MEMDQQQSNGENTPMMSREGLQKIGMLVAGIAHNLYGPLTGIMGTVDLLKLKYPDQAKDLERVTVLGKRLRDEIKTMLYKAEIEMVHKVNQVDLVQIVTNELEFYKGDPRLKHMTQVAFTPPENLPVFQGLPGDFSQSFSNLLTNAIEALDESEEKRITVQLNHAGEYIALSVEDTGVGMDEETLARAFEPFFTTKTPQPPTKLPPILATGLGLTHVKNLMEPLGVEISLESTPGEGTKASLLIPYQAIAKTFEGREGEVVG